MQLNRVCSTVGGDNGSCTDYQVLNNADYFAWWWGAYPLAMGLKESVTKLNQAHSKLNKILQFAVLGCQPH